MTSRTEEKAPRYNAPELKQLLMETRALAEVPLFLYRDLKLKGLPRGDGHGVMVVPGFGAYDWITAPLRRSLDRIGYSTYGWGHGLNLGMRSSIKASLAQRLRDIHERHEGPVSLIGWSLGGVFVREMARHQPQLVRRVITLAAPINGHPEANNLVTLFRLANLGKPVKTDMEGFLRRRTPPPVPCTSIYSKSDGLVDWRCTLEQPAPNTENVEVRGSHAGLAYNPQVLREIAKRLAQPVG